MDWRYATASVVCAAGLTAFATLATAELAPQPAPRSIEASPILVARAEPAPVVQVAAPAAPAPVASELPPPAPPPPPVVPSAPPAPETPAVPPRNAVAGLEPQRLRSAAPQGDMAMMTPPVHVAPPVPKRPPVDHRYDGTLTAAEIGRIKASLRLSPDQEPYWSPVAMLLRELGRQQMAQVDAGQKPDFSMSGDLSSRFYTAASALLGVLRDDQKEEVRKRARMMGLEAYASFI